MAERLRRYGQWAGNEAGEIEDVTKCVQKVWPSGRRMIPYQCTRKRGYGPDGLYCSQHGATEDKRQQRAASPATEERQQ